MTQVDQSYMRDDLQNEKHKKHKNRRTKKNIGKYKYRWLEFAPFNDGLSLKASGSKDQNGIKH